MSPDCAPRDSYLDGTLAADARASFEAHAAGCAECTAALASWSRSTGTLNAWAKSFDRAPTSNEVAQLIEKAEAPKASWIPRSFALVAVGAAALLAFVILRPAALKTVELSDAMAKAEVDGDRVAISQGSKATVRELAPGQTRVRLEAGSVVSKVMKRRAGGFFIVEAGDTEVRVVGTLFEVQRVGAGVAVRVREGRVEVWRGTSKLQVLSAGEAWADGEASSRALSDDEARPMLEAIGEPLPVVAAVVAPSPKVDLEAVVRDAGEGAVEGAAEEVKASPDKKTGEWTRACGTRGASAAAARREMAEYLKGTPSDSETWQLLGICLSHANEVRSASSAFNKAISAGNARQANEARLSFANMLEKVRNYASVKGQMQDYLKQPAAAKANEPEALMKLGRAQAMLGENEAAKSTLTRLLNDFPKSVQVSQARTLRDSL
ncbi:MAG: FecR domain-containing protein [Myxococcaceae bacterium]